MSESIREIIAQKALLLRDVDTLGPGKAAEELVALSSILSSLNKEISDCRYWFNLKRLDLLKEHGSFTKATVYAEASQEYKDWKDREVQKDAVVEMIRSVKYYLRGAEQEMKESKY